MSGVPTTKVTYFSDLEPSPRYFDQSIAIHKTIPDLIIDHLDEHHLAADLWEIASATFAVDRNLKRPALNKWHKGQEWHRSIETTIPVQNPAWWSQHSSDVENLLNWLTSDTWRLEFAQGKAIASTMSLLSNQDIGFEGRTALFSGGLDSVCGVIEDLESSSDPLHAVSVSTNNRSPGSPSNSRYGWTTRRTPREAVASSSSPPGSSPRSLAARTHCGCTRTALGPST
ncbi:hypothetical protein ACWGKS_29230 [Nocardiopsis sp. NPDC055879]